MHILLLKVLFLVGAVFFMSIQLFLAFHHQPRKKHAQIKWGYEVAILILSVVIIVISLRAMVLNNHLFWHLLFVLIAGVYIGLVHVASNLVGRYS